MVLLVATFFFSSLVSGAVLDLVSATDLEQQPATSADPSLQILNSISQSGKLTNATIPSSLGNPEMWVKCLPALGHDLSIDSCEEAFLRMDRSPGLKTWGPRGEGSFSKPLPDRHISTDGTCLLGPELALGSHTATGTNENTLVGLIGVFLLCITARPGQTIGGVAHNVSGDEALVAFVNKFDPSEIYCSSSMPGSGMESSCRSILDTMPADERARWFGPDERTEGGVALPKSFTSRDGRCKMTIQAPRGRDDLSWQHLYDTGVAIVGMCVRTGKQGGTRAVGKLTMEFRAASSADLTTS